MKRYLNKELSAKERATDLLNRMTVAEKMAQVNCYFMTKNDNFDGLKKDFPFGVGQISALEMRNNYNIEDDVKMQISAQKIVLKNSRFHIPAIFHMEGLSGAYISGATSFSSGIGRGSSWNPILEHNIGEIVGRQERALGITNTLAPVLDVTRDSRMGRQGESYGEDPTLVSAMGTAMVKGLQECSFGRTTQAVAKHFAASQSTLGGIHGAENEQSQRVVQEVYAKPFQAAISLGNIRGIMPCYASVDGLPTSVSRPMLTSLLRNSMGFDGLTISDYVAISNAHSVQKIGNTYTEAGLKAMTAGLDMELHFKQCFNDELGKWFKENKADIEILNRAVFRVLKAKFEMGLFEKPYSLSGDELKENFSVPNDKKVALDSSEESMILLKNDGVLPIDSSKTKKILVVGPHAESARYYFNGYTHFSMLEGNLAAIATMAGLETKNDGSIKVNTIPGSKVERDNEKFETVFKKLNPSVPNLLEQLQKDFPEIEIKYEHGYDIAGNDYSGFDSAIDKARGADVVIMTLGGKYGTGSVATTGEGIDSTNINLPECQDRFIEAISKLNIPLVGVHFDGRPISSDAADSKLNAILEAWSPAEMGSQALENILFGRTNPSGKLPVSVARNAGQIPVHYNHLNGSSYHQGESVGFSDYVDISHRPRYYFGHGLSYTEFKYQNLVIDKSEITSDECVNISVDVSNVGQLDGTEVVQLYVTDKYASMTRPVTELAGFTRVFLRVGQSKTVKFILKASQLAFLDEDMNWCVETGDIIVSINKNADEVVLNDKFKISNTKLIQGKDRALYADSIVLGDENDA
ncbi:beta-glucosidase [Paucilactobacillus vaccinostercus DSM 20634]|uniref:Beta-glucosidase n=1 Tax=Paucilactobacillus vaccinostercus DSM 20634 TaxID=1423813 RepID=A0A0R2A7Y9_9LACO|nr:glycoside hydrolase family 3 N-terminal domain-containing protein [Paucilactobacillus vaccinostercus]KRM62730.1 beta-glucosidase [Paucilactobacillus vaccinostercus DSM 20634]